ncbi:epoxyqueuosine reductase QueH [Sphingomonas sp.]|uniref:epoxyqueuosine reductase QueH n=1 Tax=Sphingomonas sp. TaxID=28214 RepID=UPI003B3B60D2
MEAMTASGIDYTIFFYNPNIHPKEEYLLRKDENIRFAEDHGVPFVDADYDTVNWFKRAKGMEWAPERGERCTMCFDMRFERTALYAHENGFPVITSSLGISRWKDMNQINGSGERAASHYPGIDYWTFNWRKGGGAARMIDISKRERFYQQEYCGCVFSLRDTNAHRVSQGRPENRDRQALLWRRRRWGNCGLGSRSIPQLPDRDCSRPVNISMARSMPIAGHGGQSPTII